MLAIQIVVDGRPGAVVRGTETALRHVADAVFGTRGDGPAIAAGLAGLRATLAELEAAGIPCHAGHLLRRHAEGGPAIALVWHDLETPPGRSSAVLRYGFDEAPDLAYLLFTALAGAREPEADAAHACRELRARCERLVRPAEGEAPRARLETLRRVQGLFAAEPRNPLALVPTESEIAGDHSGALAVMPERVADRFEALAAGLSTPVVPVA